MDGLKQRYQHLVEKIRQLERQYGREQGTVTLVAVSKTHPESAIREMAALGQTAFGENYLQEAIAKQHELDDLDLQWHFIGHIQSNKTREIAEHFDWVHGVDRAKIADRLSGQRPGHLPPINVCIQLNLEGESTKSGVAPDELPELAQQVAQLPNLKLRGLMAIPPPDNPFETQRKLFARMKSLFVALNHTGLNLDVLSMGMTDDMEAAIAEGATHIRIGTALFGPRHYN